MEKELDPEVIKETQNILGKYVKRPPLTEKLLKKPPFRFLHDIVTTVLKSTGFFEGLFEDDELVSDNVKDRESKILFLNKVITVLNFTTGKSLSVKPSKIVAGQEPAKTNELLQCIAEALDNKLSTDQAVKKFKESAKAPKAKLQQDEKKTTEPAIPVKKNNEVKKLTAKGTEKVNSQTSDKKTVRDRADRSQSQTRNEKEKVHNVTKAKSKENITSKKESPPKKVSSTKTVSKSNSVDKIKTVEKQPSIEKLKPKLSTTSSNATNKDQHNIENEEDEKKFIGLSDKQIRSEVTEIDTASPKQTADRKLTATSYTIADHDLKALSSQDLAELEENPAEVAKSKDLNHTDTNKDDKSPKREQVQNVEKDYNNKTEPTTRIQSDRLSALSSETSVEKEAVQNQMIPNHESIIETAKNERPPSVRPASVRPSSSRPGAPRLREKHENTSTGGESLLVGKVNIIVENPTNEEEEESIIIVDQEESNSTPQEQLELTSSEHGHLVQQILESQKEFSQATGKTEIEWQFGAQKAREALNQEIEQLRFNIQALSRAANPLGKVLDHIQEDVEVMRQELQQWATTYDEASKELVKQKMANDDSLLPLHTRLKQLDAEIVEKRDKINDLKIVIHKNSSRIEKLLASGSVQ